MRIVFVAHHGSVHTRRWVGFFAQRGHEVHVVTCGDEGAPAEGYAVYDLDRPRVGKLGYFAKVRRARAIIRSLRPDVVHAHHATSYGMLGLLSGVRPLVVTAHGSDLLMVARRNAAARWIVRRVLRAASLVTVPSEPMREAAIRLAAPANPPIRVFQYGVDAARLIRVAREIREGAAVQPGGPLRLASARPLERLYRFDALLDALALLHKQGVRFRADLYGDGSQRPRLEERARALGLGHAVVFHGRVPAERVERGLAEADLYLSVSQSDGTSIALLEAMALGAIPVVSDIPANRAWIENGANGVLVPIEGRAIAAGILRAAGMPRARVREANARLILQRADRESSLSFCESLLEAVVTGQSLGA